MACHPGHLHCAVGDRDKRGRTGGMDESLSAVKSVRHSQSRGAKTSSAQKSNKEASVQREGVKSALRSKENLTAAKDDRNAGSQVSRAPGSTYPDEKKRGRPNRGTRLSGRSSSGESNKGKGANSQHQPSESRTPISADTCSSSANRETTASLLPATTGRGLTQQNHTSTGASAKEKSHGETFPRDV